MRFHPKFWSKLRSTLYVSTGGFVVFAGYSVYNEKEAFYDNLLMPLVHKLDPEVSHRFAIAVAKYNLLPPSRFKDPDTLRTSLWGIDFKNPIGLAAGFDKDAEAVGSLHNLGFGFVEIGSVTPLPQPGNQKPRVFRLKEYSAVINRYGFNSEGHEAVLERIKAIKSKENSGDIVGVNLGKNKLSTDPVEDYVRGIKLFAPFADYLVINISSPNTPGLRDWQQKNQLETLLCALVEARNSQNRRPPLLLKLSPDLSSDERKDIAEVITKPKCKIDGLIISNTTVARPGISSAEGDEVGGLSGAPLHSYSTQLIYDMFELTKGEVTIIGVGGVFSGKDAFEKVEAGASLVQLYTALSYHGPPRIARVKRELHQYLSERGFSNISEAVGSGHKRSHK